MSSNSTTTTTFVLYHYNPSKALAEIYLGCFFVAIIGHLYFLARRRTWYFIPFIIGLIFEALGYEGRNLSAGQSPNWTTGPYILQSLTLLLGPTLLAASIYMTLGRFIRFLEAESHSVIPPKWLTKVFVLGDVLSFLVQSGGGAMMSKATTESGIKTGENIIMVGLIIQILFFGFFIVVTLLFHRRIHRSPTSFSMVTTTPWQRFLYVLYAASALIMIRSVFRVAEYAGGYSGPLQSTEVYIYVFDASLMFIVAVLFFAFHPSTVMTRTPVYKGGSYPLSGGASSYEPMA